MGVLNNLIPFGLIVWGQTKIAGGLASILNATTPLFTVILAHFLTRDEQITFGKLLGIVIGLLGVTVMIGPEVFKGFDLNVLAELAVIGAAVSYALAGIFGRRFKDLSPFVTATGQASASAVVLLLIALFSHGSLFTVVPSPTTIGAVAALGLVCTAVAYMLYFRILASSGATNVLLVTLLIPVSALLLGTTILGEKIAPQDLAGMALIALGLGAIDGRILSFVRPNRSSGKIEGKTLTFEKLRMYKEYEVTMNHVVVEGYRTDDQRWEAVIRRDIKARGRLCLWGEDHRRLLSAQLFLPIAQQGKTFSFSTGSRRPKKQGFALVKDAGPTGCLSMNRSIRVSSGPAGCWKRPRNPLPFDTWPGRSV